jgi:DNA (cytosine-5)-methyltransferase 1
MQLNHIGLFEGIGGFSLAARWMGWKTVAWCEINPFCQQVLRYHFPDATGHADITKTNFKSYANTVDIVSGGFPCQPFSQAGKQLGTEDERHLWPEMLRTIHEIQPRYVVGENVRGFVNWNAGLVFDQVQADLENAGYEVLTFILPACGIGAPHKRDRIFIIAYNHSFIRGTGGNAEPRKQSRYREGILSVGTKRYVADPYSAGIQRPWDPQKGAGSANDNCFISRPAADTDNTGCGQGHKKNAGGSSEQPDGNSISGTDTDANGNGLQGGRGQEGTGKAGQQIEQLHAPEVWKTWENFPFEPPLCSGNDGLSAELVGITFPKHRKESIKAYGNAVVPQLPYIIFQVIEQMELNRVK